jgi:misacylated tRNA(Ala) deacylase
MDAQEPLKSKEVDARMHTAEHILTATMMKLFGCGRPFTTHIERRKSKADYRFDRNLSLKEISQVQEQVNEVVRLNLPVRAEFLCQSEAERAHDLSRLPPQAREAVRIVRIGDYDACPCIGPHVNGTREIGVFRIVSTDYTDGSLRIRFRLEPSSA